MVISYKQLRRYILFLLMIFVLAVELPIYLAGQQTKPEPADVMIVLGAKLLGAAPSPFLRLRLDKAAELYNESYAPAIIVSGAKGRDEDISEASAMKEYLIKQGIPGEVIITEDASFNTYQNLANSRAIMEKHGFKKALVVSSASHIRRSLVLCSYLNIDACGAPAPMPPTLKTAGQYLREGAAMLALVVTRH